jgi:hypothetical protein
MISGRRLPTPSTAPKLLGTFIDDDDEAEVYYAQ